MNTNKRKFWKKIRVINPAPFVSLEYTLLLFATFIFHRHYFGPANAVTDLLILYGQIQIVLYIYGFIVLLASLIKIPPDWLPLVELLVFLGSFLMDLAYMAVFWIDFAMPSWPEILVQLYYVFQGVISLVLVIILLTQEEGQSLSVEPHLVGIPVPLKALCILVYVVVMTLVLYRGFSIAPDTVTAWVNLGGMFLLVVLPNLKQRFGAGGYG